MRSAHISTVIKIRVLCPGLFPADVWVVTRRSYERAVRLGQLKSRENNPRSRASGRRLRGIS